jgi:hypothetical protein
LHENFLLTLGFSALRDNLDAVADFINKLLDVLDLMDSVAEEEASISLNPLGDSVLQLVSKRVHVHSDPANVNADFHF